MKKRFEEFTHEELRNTIEKNTVILLPVGQIEQHGLHLPVKPDAFIAEKICEISEIPVIVMPKIYYGYSTKKVMLGVLKWLEGGGDP